MDAALFVPCYVDQFYPRVGLAAAEVLERHGVRVTFPEDQTCCGQPMANAGSVEDARPLAEKFLRVFGQHRYVVCPSGSCTSMVRNHYGPLLGERASELHGKVFELCEFLHDVVQARPRGRFAARVGLHQSCHGLRELRLGTGSERILPARDKVRDLLSGIEGLHAVPPQRHDQAVWWVRQKRDRAASALPEWEELREQASRIKAHALSRLADYLEQFERNATARGARVHWARDADEHNRIVHGILAERGVTRLVKSKSMLTEECHLNPYLIAHGIEVVDTDLGERIVQLAKEPPSHIVMPAIHKKKEEIGELFHEKLGTPVGLSDPTKLTEAARGHLREKFLAAQAGLTGVNFAIAETGGVAGCTHPRHTRPGASR